jgi:iron complex transport system substrate-binding protein
MHRNPFRRRTIRVAAALIALTLIATACGSDDDNVSEAGVPATSAEDVTETASRSAEDTRSEEEEAATKVVETFDGAVEVPVDPQRIVALTDQNAMLPLLELGVVPIGSNGALGPDGGQFFRRVEDFDTTQVTWLGPCCDANLEAIAALVPDLIVTDQFAGSGQYEQLLQIAPVVRFDPHEQPIVRALEQWADLFDRSDRATELADAYGERLDEVIAAVGDPSEITIAVVTVWQANWYFGDGSHATRQVIDDLGLARPATWDPDGEFSLEQFPENLADLVIVYDFGGRESPDTDVDAFVDSPIFAAHPAVAAGQWLRVDATVTVGSAWSKMMNLLDVLEPLLADAELDRSIAP